MEHRLSTVSDLAGALERGELEVVYQCVVELDSMKIVGCEALVRWHHPRYGLINPSEFIPAAEESGLIVPIGLWVLQQACRDALQWPDDITLAVNVSAVQIGSPSIVESILETVRDTGMLPARVELEITESAISRNDQAARGVLQRFRGHGFQLAIDDFGTGYSSMAQLRELPFDTLKLDRSFVAGLGGERSGASNAIISSLLHLSRSMNMSVIAEGVETRAEWKTLQQLGCQYGQGYLFARPQSQRQLLRTVHAGYLDHA
jgi:EAL domain-containing protein (putative c-di-GMP-specific phosphodiesterase class I)